MPSRRKFIMTGMGVGAAAFLHPLLALSATKNGSSLLAGASRQEIVFATSLFPLDQFAAQHDPLAVRILLLDNRSEKIAIAVIDLTSISDETVVAMKAIITKISGISANDILICASHSFSTPHVFPADHLPAGSNLEHNHAVLQAYENALRSATENAFKNMRPASVGYGKGVSRVAINRDVETPHGWWLGSNDAGFTDTELGVLRINGADDKPIAVLMNYAVQSSVLDGSTLKDGTQQLSADLAGAASRHVEAYFGHDAVALFLVGAAGDQSPYLQANRHVVNQDGSVARLDIHEAGFNLLDLLGERLGNDVIDTTRKISTASPEKLKVLRISVDVTSQNFSPENKPVGPVTHFNYESGAKVAVPVVLTFLGDTVIVGLQAELAAVAGANIRAQSPYPHTMVNTMVDGAAKYMPDAQSYDRFTYEARNSPYAKGTAEAVTQAIIGTLNSIKNK